LVFPLGTNPDPEHLKANRLLFESQMDRFSIRPERASGMCKTETLPLEIVPIGQHNRNRKAPFLFSTLLTAVEVAGSHRCPREFLGPLPRVFAPRGTTPSAALPPAPLPDPGAEPTPAVSHPSNSCDLRRLSRSDLVGSAQLSESLGGVGHDPRSVCAEPYLKSRTPQMLPRHCL